MIITILVFLLILTVLVLIHEAGHYFVAKKFGIKVEEFGFGIPPRAFGIKRGETIFSINWLPVGGFVKLYGEDEAGGGRVTGNAKQATSDTKDLHRAFFTKPAWQRFSVIVAGVVMNFVLACLLFYIFLGASNFTTDLPLLTKHTFYFTNQTVYSGAVVDAIAPNSPAQQAGMNAPLQIVSVNGQKIDRVDTFVEQINKEKGKEVTITWKELATNTQKTATLVPRLNHPKNEGALGVSLMYLPFPLARLSYDTPAQKAFSGIIHPVNFTLYQLHVLGDLIGKSFAQRDIAPVRGSVSGPVGIGSLVGAILQIPDLKTVVLQLINLSGILSVSLAFFNVLPIPALDGGRLFFILIEVVSGRRLNQDIENKINTVGMMLLLSLILLITFQDILRLFGK